MKFESDSEYRQAIEKEIEARSGGDVGKAADLKRDFALERCMSRFDPKEVAVKGGYGVRTLVEASPYTMDVDLLVDNINLNSLQSLF